MSTHIKQAKSLLRIPGTATALGGFVTDKIWTRTGDRNVAAVGALSIERAATEKPFWRIVRITSEGGGQTVIGHSAYTSTELVAFLEGVRASVEVSR